MAGPDLFFDLELFLVLRVVALRFFERHGAGIGQGGRCEQEVVDLGPGGDGIAGLAGLIVLVDALVRGRDLVLIALPRVHYIGGHRRAASICVEIAGLVLAQPSRDADVGPQLVHDHPAHVFGLELAGGQVVGPQYGLVGIGVEGLAFVLEGGDEVDLLGQLFLGDAEPQLGGLLQHQFLDDHLFEDLSFESHLGQHFGGQIRVLAAREFEIALQTLLKRLKKDGRIVDRGDDGGVVVLHAIHAKGQNKHGNDDAEEDLYSPTLGALAQDIKHGISDKVSEVKNKWKCPGAFIFACR